MFQKFPWEDKYGIIQKNQTKYGDINIAQKGQKGVLAQTEKDVKCKRFVSEICDSKKVM